MENFIRKSQDHWPLLPEEGQRVEVEFGSSTSTTFWFYNGYFVNCYGYPVRSIIGWRPLQEAKAAETK